MPTEVDARRELARAFWEGRDPMCPRHNVKVRATFVESTYFDHIAVDCPKGKETFTIPQRPRQSRFNAHQLEGLVVFIEQGDNVLCYRCQSRLQIERNDDAVTGVTHFEFTCIRCLSYGSWTGKPEKANIVGVTEALAAN